MPPESCAAPARAASGARSSEPRCLPPRSAACAAADGEGRGLPGRAAPGSPGLGAASAGVSPAGRAAVGPALDQHAPSHTSAHQYSLSLRPPSCQVGFSHSCAPSAGPQPGTAPAPHWHRSGTALAPFRHRIGTAPAPLQHYSGTALAPPSPWPTAAPRGQEHPAAGLGSSQQPRRGPWCQLGRGALPAAPQGPDKIHTSSETKAFLPSNSFEKRCWERCCNAWLW